MGSYTDACIEAFQESTGIKPAKGEHADRLDKMAKAAFELIQAITLESSGIRDGNGMWHVCDPLHAIAGQIADLEASRCSEVSASHEAADRSRKADLLAKYAEKPVTAFSQFDGFIVSHEGDDVMRPDGDGHCIMCGDTEELMHGADVRVLVKPDTLVKDASAMLRKIADIIDRDGVKLPGAPLFDSDTRELSADWGDAA